MDNKLQQLKRALELDPENLGLKEQYQALLARLNINLNGETLAEIIEKRNKDLKENFGSLLQRRFEGASQVFHNEEYGSYVQIPFSTFLDGCVNTNLFFTELYNEGLDVSFITVAEEPDRVIVFFNTAPYGFNDFERINNCARKHNPFVAPGEIIQSDETVEEKDKAATVTVEDRVKEKDE